MTLILALPGTDGIALVSDTRKWLPTGAYIDGYHKLVASHDGLVTGTGSGYLLDYVAAYAAHRVFPEIVLLLQHIATCCSQGEEAEWTLTAEGRSPCHARGEHGVGFAVFDGRLFKTPGWLAGSLPTGLPLRFLRQTIHRVKPIREGGCCLEKIRTIAFDICSDLYSSGLISPDFDFGTHRPGRQLSIERLYLSTPAICRTSRSRPEGRVT